MEFGVDVMVRIVREALQEECEVRKQEIQFLQVRVSKLIIVEYSALQNHLQGCVEEASQRTRRIDGTCKEPSIQGLLFSSHTPPHPPHMVQ